MRDDRIMAAETKAAKLPATLTVPMILFILPPLVRRPARPRNYEGLKPLALISHARFLQQQSSLPQPFSPTGLSG